MDLHSPVIDFHSHILAGVDHGCECTDESIRQLELMRSHGTDIVVATPHFYPHINTVDSFSGKIHRAISRLSEVGVSSAPRLCVGAEVLLCDNLCSMSGLDSLCIRGTKILLIELPIQHLKESHFDTVEELISKGYTVMLAHIDRYAHHYGNDIKSLLELGAIAQINADCMGHPSIKRFILDLLKNTDSIYAVGSDLHGVDEKLYKKFATIDKHLHEYFKKIMSRSAKLLEPAEFIQL